MIFFLSARTCGDGMENVNPTLTPNESKSKPSDSLDKVIEKRSPSNHVSLPPTITKVPGQDLIYKHNFATPSPPAILPKGKIFNMIPRLVTTHKTFSVQSKNKAPRFVPFEPYKAAINPIIPLRHPKPVQKNRKNNLDLNTLVSHMSTMKMSSMKSETTSDDKEVSELEKQRLNYERQLEDLRKDRDCANAQLKSQVQVNTELKNLLVAAVGEDLQTRVNVLTEDKLELARALLSSADDLSSHTVCDIWVNSFLFI